MAFLLLLTMCASLLTGGLAVPVASRAPSVKIGQGTITGTTVVLSQTIEEFLGIRYATAPIGKNRYLPPVELPDGTGAIDGTSYKSVCIQSSPGIIASNESEDCLYLNVFRAAGTASSSNLPVVVYIHGGSFNGGSGASRDIFRMVSYSAQPIIGVSINYRVGALGFLSSSVTQKEGVLNLGLKDQLMALQWVQKNIAAFGGDPNKVTLMGDSAGGHSVGHHLQSPLSKGLFSQVIMESGAPTARFCQPPTNALPTKQFEGFLEAVNISPSMSSDDIMAALRSQSLTAQEIKDASASVYSFYNPSIRWAFQPVIDGDGGFIPKAPLSMWNSGSWNKVPILTGFCTNEGAPFVPYSMETSEEFTSFFQVLNPELTPVDIGAINSLYPDPLIDKASPYLQTQAGPGAEYNRITAAYGQFGYISPIRQSAFYASTSSNTPVYLYQFAANSSVTQGTGHDCVGGYTTYESYITSVSATQQNLAASVVGYWTSFIATGDPNGVNRNTAISASKKAVWPQYHSVSLTPNKLLFGKGNDERAGGKSVGVITQSEIDTEFIVETTFWGLHTGSTEN